MRKEQRCLTVSHEAIYQYVWKDKKKGGRYTSICATNGAGIKNKGIRKSNRGVISNRVSIEQRPLIVEQRKRVGNFQIDLVWGKNHKNAILTIAERKSGFALLRKLPSKQADVIARQIIKALLPIKPYVHTITSNNGKAFSQHECIAKALEADFYFAHPYRSWQRGTNENYNCLLRQYFPKKNFI